jgi:hypothetical protein
VALLINLEKCQFGWLIVLSRADPPPGTDHRLSYWKCRCRCGVEIICRSDALRGCTRRRCGPFCTHRETKIRITRTEISQRNPAGSLQILEVISEEKTWVP